MPEEKQDLRQNHIDNITNLADKTLEAILDFERDAELDEERDASIIELRDAIETAMANFQS